MTDSTFIYALTDPRPGDLHVYIGKADHPEKRYVKHITLARQEQNYKARWIRVLRQSGLRPGLEILQEVPKSDWPSAEATFIRWYRVLGWRVVNSTDGGEGLSNPHLETRLKLSRLARGRKISDETRKRLSESHKGLPISAEARRNLSVALTGRTLSKEHREAIRVSLTGERNPLFGKPLSKEHRAKVGRKGAKHHNFGKRMSEEQKAKIRASISGPNSPLFGKSPSLETRAKIRASKIGTKHSPEARAKMSVAQRGRITSPETRLKISKALAGRRLSEETLTKRKLARRMIGGMRNQMQFQFV